MAIADAIRFRKRLHALIDGKEYAEVGHAHCHIGKTADCLRKIIPNLKNMGLRGAEYGHRTVRFLAVAVKIRIVLRAIIMETESRAQVTDTDFIVCFREHRESVE